MRKGGIVLAWGPPRSGTTWLYNAVRGVLAAGGVSAASWAAGQELPADRRPDMLIVKSHQANAIDFFLGHDTSNIQALVIFRDPVAAFQSLIRTQDAPRADLIGWLRRDVDSFLTTLPQLPRAAVCREEWIRDRSPDMIAAFSRLLGLPLSPEQAATVAESLSKERVGDQVRELRSQHGWNEEFSKFDRETQWHANHIAPPDYVPAEPTPDEAERLAGIADDVERLTTTYSLWEAPAAGEWSGTTSGPTIAEEYLAYERAQSRSGVLSRIFGRR